MDNFLVSKKNSTQVSPTILYYGREVRLWGKCGVGFFGNVSAESRYGFATKGYFLLSNFLCMRVRVNDTEMLYLSKKVRSSCTNYHLQ